MVVGRSSRRQLIVRRLSLTNKRCQWHGARRFFGVGCGGALGCAVHDAPPSPRFVPAVLRRVRWFSRCGSGCAGRFGAMVPDTKCGHACRLASTHGVVAFACASLPRVVPGLPGRAGSPGPAVADREGDRERSAGRRGKSPSARTASTRPSKSVAVGGQRWAIAGGYGRGCRADDSSRVESPGGDDARVYGPGGFIPPPATARRAPAGTPPLPRS